jgi:hypothetical protein
MADMDHNEVPEGDVQHRVHSLHEIRQGHALTGEQKAKRLARSLPTIIIAVMVHVSIAAVLGMMYYEQKEKEEAQANIEAGMRASEEAPKIEEAPKVEENIERTAIPEVENTDISDVTEEFSTVVDDTVNPDATSAERFGMAEGTDDAQDNLLTLSSGGKGLAGAIGIGAGSGPGGGMRKGNPLGGSRLGRRNEQKAKLEATEKVVMAGLDWLKRHQSPDGSWDPAAYTGMCDGKLGEACWGKGSAGHVAGLTGLALLTYLGAGYDSQRPGPYTEVVKNGLKWLRKAQDSEGCFGSRGDQHFTYDHACATLAMCEGYASTKQSTWKTPAQNGLNFITACQNPYKGWRYGKKPGDNDSSVTGWMLMALKSGKDCGLEVSESSMKDGIALVNSLTDKDTGRTGYTKVGELPVRQEGKQEKWPGSESEALTAVAMCSRIFTQTAEEDAGLMKLGADLLSKRLPVWDEAGGKIDMYYWYYGTLAMFQVGGSDWERWNRALKEVVVDHQIKDGCMKGSWDPKDPWADDGGRVYSACLMTLCLEVYYRFPRVFGATTNKK